MIATCHRSYFYMEHGAFNPFTSTMTGFAKNGNVIIVFDNDTAKSKSPSLSTFEVQTSRFPLEK